MQEEAAQAGIAEQRRQFDITTGRLESAEEANRRALQIGKQQQRRELRPFSQAGLGALEQQQALLGLGTPEQQAAAQQAITETPGQRFIRDRQQRALLRGSAAIGGLGGGNVRTALQEQAAGFAQQDLGNQFARLQDLTRGGQVAATNLGQGALTTASGIGTGALGSAARQGQFGAQAAGNIAQLQGAVGQARASGILGAQQAQTDQFGNLIQLGAGLFSDKRLKSKIKKVGEVNGFNWYSWTWNNLAHSLGLFGDDNGVIADEVQQVKPELVTERDGFLTVNYAGLGV